jgi:hypothetical protein
LKSQVLDGIETAIMAVLRKASQAYDVTDEFDTFVTLHGEQQGAHAPWDRQNTNITAKPPRPSSGLDTEMRNGRSNELQCSTG